MVSTLAPIASHSARTLATASGSAPSGGVRMRPAIDEQRGEARVRAGLLRARHRVGRDEPRMRGQNRLELRDHRGLDRADVRHDRARLQRRRDRPTDLPVRADRRAEDDAIGVPRPLRRDRSCRRRPRPSASARARALRRSVRDHDPARRVLLADGAGERRPDQPDPDDRQLAEHRLIERRPEPLSHDRVLTNSVSASTTPRFASSSPTVSRRHSGSP